MTLSAPVASALGSLEQAWQRSDRIFSLLREDAWLERPIPLRHPFLFYLGHLPCFAWIHLGRRTLGRPPLDAGFEALFERGIDPRDTGDAEAARAAWPGLGEVIRYRERARGELRSGLADAQVPYGSALAMVDEHERMHHETLLYMLHALGHDKKLPPPSLPAPPAGAAGQPARIRVPRGRALLGRPRDQGFAWDNEYPEHVADVAGFEVDALPVTNAQFLEFVEAGGYARGALWSDEAWAWLLRGGRRHPQFWKRERAGYAARGLFADAPLRNAGDHPVYVTWAEANAYARWRGQRLMSEAEFQRAAFATPEGGHRAHPWGDAAPDAEHGNLDLRCFGPAPIGSHPAGASAWGVQELVGNGWEWTSTRFAGFDGFVPLDAYPGYSADFFDGRHFVLLGASWATDARLVRRSFRNWYQPHYPYVFAKFRCAAARD